MTTDVDYVDQRRAYTRKREERGLSPGLASLLLLTALAAARDSFEGVTLQKTIAAVTIAFALVPGLTPLLGALTQELAGWRAVFWLTRAVGGLIAVLAFIKLPETLRGQPAELSVSAALRGYAAVAGDRIAMTYALAAGLVFGAMSAFFAASPTLFIDHLGVGAVEYGLYPPIAVTGFIIGGIITRHLAGKVPAIRIAATGLTIMAVALSLMLAFPAAGAVHKHIFNATMVMNVTGLGVFLPTAITQVLARFPDRAGTAAAMQGFIQMLGGAMGAFAVSGLQAHLPLLAMPTVMLACVLLSASVFTLGLSTARRAPIQA